MLNEKKENVLVTGASRGIGREIAIKFAKEGYGIVINCNNSVNKLNNLRDYITQQYKVPCLSIAGNVGESRFVNSMFDTAEKEIGEIGILINNAGISHIGLLSDVSDSEWNTIMNTNLSSVFFTSRRVIPSMVRNQCGKIINISSVWGICGASCEAAYSATKGAVNSLTKALGKELAPSNIQVNAIACGVIDTDMNNCFCADEKKSLENEIPAGRFGKPEEVAELAFTIATSHNYMTGQIITLDGGWI